MEDPDQTLEPALSRTGQHQAHRHKYHQQQDKRQMTNSAVLFINMGVNTFSLFKMEYTFKGLLLLNHNTIFFKWLIFS